MSAHERTETTTSSSTIIETTQPTTRLRFSKRCIQVLIAILVGLVCLHVGRDYAGQQSLFRTSFSNEIQTTVGKNSNSNTTLTANAPRPPSKKKFYILPLPELTTWLVGNFTRESIEFYEETGNEAQIEIWLHRGLQQLSLASDRTEDPLEADVVIVSAYLHLYSELIRKDVKKGENRPYPTEEWVQLVRQRIVPNKTHVIAIPTCNPGTRRAIFLDDLKSVLQQSGVPILSFGTERNTAWQLVDADRIIPVPYVVKPEMSRDRLPALMNVANRKSNFCFYAGDARPNAVQWGGCNRTKLITPLSNRSDLGDMRIVSRTNRLTQDEYNIRMYTSEFCLIVCGDTPTSRSFASSMLHGCIPLRIGSRLRGHCEPPCKSGWGWQVTHGLMHLPFEDKIDWNLFPEVDEAAFMDDAPAVLHNFFRETSAQKKAELREVMAKTQFAWVYGWGNPVTSTEFGQAVEYAWDSLVDFLMKNGEGGLEKQPRLGMFRRARILSSLH